MKRLSGLIMSVLIITGCVLLTACNNKDFTWRNNAVSAYQSANFMPSLSQLMPESVNNAVSEAENRVSSSPALAASVLVAESAFTEGSSFYTKADLNKAASGSQEFDQIAANFNNIEARLISYKSEAISILSSITTADTWQTRSMSSGTGRMKFTETSGGAKTIFYEKTLNGFTEKTSVFLSADGNTVEVYSKQTDIEIFTKNEDGKRFTVLSSMETGVSYIEFEKNGDDFKGTEAYFYPSLNSGMLVIMEGGKDEFWRVQKQYTMSPGGQESPESEIITSFKNGGCFSLSAIKNGFYEAIISLNDIDGYEKIYYETITSNQLKFLGLKLTGGGELYDSTQEMTEHYMFSIGTVYLPQANKEPPKTVPSVSLNIFLIDIADSPESRLPEGLSLNKNFDFSLRSTHNNIASTLKIKSIASVSELTVVTNAETVRTNLLTHLASKAYTD